MQRLFIVGNPLCTAWSFVCLGSRVLLITRRHWPSGNTSQEGEGYRSIEWVRVTPRYGIRFIRSSRSGKGLLLRRNDPEIGYLLWKAAPHLRPHPSGFLSSVKRTNAHPIVTG